MYHWTYLVTSEHFISAHLLHILTYYWNVIVKEPAKQVGYIPSHIPLIHLHFFLSNWIIVAYCDYSINLSCVSGTRLSHEAFSSF